MSTERAYVQDVVEKQYRYALIGRSWGERAIADPMPYALASVQASQALVLLVKLGFEREATRESRLREAVRLAEDGAARLATTRRAPTAATAQMTKAEALLLLTEMPSIKEPDLLRAEAIGALGDSVALLARSRSLEINELREEYDELWHHLSRVRKRYSLII